MPKSSFSALLLGLLFTVWPAGPAGAHTGHKEEPVKAEKPTVEGSIYAVEEEESEHGVTTEGVDLPGSSFSRTDIFSEEIPMTPEPMQHMDHGSMLPMEHKMPEVKLAEHEWVSTGQKGYGAAAAITLLSGLVFGFLSFKRPGG